MRNQIIYSVLQVLLVIMSASSGYMFYMCRNAPLLEEELRQEKDVVRTRTIILGQVEDERDLLREEVAKLKAELEALKNEGAQ